MPVLLPIDEMKADMLPGMLRQHLSMAEMFQQKREFSTAKQFRELAQNYATEIKRRGLELPEEASRLAPITQADIDRAAQEHRKTTAEVDRELDGWDDPDR